MALLRRARTLLARNTLVRRGLRSIRTTVRRRELEVLESRELLTTFTVTNLHATGAGSLRQAIIQSNSHPGPDTIDFGVTGTIRAGRHSLPAITGPTTIDGSSAPGFAGSPVVTLNFNGTKGLRFAAGSDGSTLKSLSLVRSGGAGVTLIGSGITVQGNEIGVMANGSTVAGNRGDGIKIDATSHADLIGQLDPVTGVSYYNTSSISPAVSAWTGIRDGWTSNQYLITGTSGSSGLLYVGPISGGGGTSYTVNYPGAAATSVYGPDIVSGNVIRLVGSYRTGTGSTNGFLFQGLTSNLGDSSYYQTISYPGATYNYLHSTMGDLVVGNGGDIPASTDHAFVYSLSQGTFTTITYPGATTVSTSAYGVWYNGGSSYTIAGGYTAPGPGGGPMISQAYLVDYNEATGQFSNWTSFAGPEGLAGPSFATHFQGISSPEPGVYTMSANTTAAGSVTPIQAALVTVKRGSDGTFGPAYWVNLTYPGSTGMGSANSVAGNQVVGVTNTGSGIIPYQATVNLGFQLSNVISGNRGNGIGIYGASGNRIAMNNIGTDATGSFARPNRENGILLTHGASQNIIGGTISAGNSPTQGVIVRPPQGNEISGNRGDGVLMTGRATGNTMSGNYVGTNASGNAGLGNRQDGVAIVRASGNSLIGCTMQDQPFVYYNVISGNRENGVRITDSNNTTVQANFLGAGANNATVVPNGRDGLLVSGRSQQTQVGGVIPLGNVISGNNGNGIAVTQKASGFTSFNTFGGTFAFGGAAPNRKDGILITSSGGNNLVRTSIVSGNGGNGIEIGGNATGVQVTDTATGTNTAIQAAIPNGGDGIKIDGHAHGNAIGGFQPSIEPQDTASGNKRFGIQVADHAHNNVIFNTNVGTTAVAVGGAIPNLMGGLDVGPGTSSTTIGGPTLPLQDNILHNDGPGVSIRSSRGDAVIGDLIGSNTGNGLTLMKARGASIGGNLLLPSAQAVAGQGNRIITNKGYGLLALGNCKGTVVQGNTIAANIQGNVNLTHSRGVRYVPKAGG